MPEPTVRDHLRDCLAEVAFPASRNTLLDAAIGHGDPTAVQALREIPKRDYADLSAVFAAVSAEDPGA
ncbi:DUF2795 domain-containing protein [Saccharothrix coeruleofusca]|uniref:DUF2795 domain-containing protein n=1 Tax=Saccharothrix coeruleofusca TaxID=33919 RepID=A0A918AS95_9PSEU|nr:DUF2795 domain-containing protein [Saccharothrix coeruleofusca]MBP2335934.1 hypothetical protein [Saccharothrix coeruleofusca]GGP76498.1 hypothetical protein GCM10010185_57800 [Saccharothrix coeruleofusca]